MKNGMRRSRLLAGLLLALGLNEPALAQSVSPNEFTPTATPPEDGLRRFALVVGINDGGAKRIPLRYAGRDAQAFHEVMTVLGGVESTDAELLSAGETQEVRGAFHQVRQKVDRARALGQHTEFLFFYSGHSDEQGLRMGESLLPYRELKSLVETVGADVQVAVLDSCASGTLTRLKGGSRRAPFLLDLSSSVRGHAFLTSASGTEAAQESDRIQASFFTHYLVTGLRGAADFNSNGRVTLNEAYRFAFDETLARTQKTQAGVQHPAYDIQLVGTGDLVMTDLKATSAGLRLPKAMAGRFFLRNTAGYLVAELYKPGGRSVELALAPGKYSIAVETDAQQLAGHVVLSENETRALSGDKLRAVEIEPTRSRGSRSPSKRAESKELYRVVPVAASIFSPLDTNEGARFDGAKILNHAQFNLVWGRTDRLEGVQYGVGNHADEGVRGVQVALAVNSTGAETEGVQIATGLNLAYGPEQGGFGGKFSGIQIATGTNLVRGTLTGGQVATGLNGVDGELRGFQVAAGVNLATGRVDGVQVAAGVNYVDSLTGLQVAAGVNAVRTKLSGLQMSGGVNFAANVVGLQTAPLNIAVKGRGAQLGVLNVMANGRAHAQVGVVNYADEADVQIGILSGTRKGGVHPGVWTSTAGEAMFSLRLDANYTYSLLHIGTNFGKNDSWNAGLGFGGKLPVVANRFYLELDASVYYLKYEGIRVEDTPQLGQGRLLGRFQLHKHLSVFGGPTFNVLWAHNAAGGRLKRPGYGGVLHSFGSEDHRVRMWPGFAAGLSF